MISAKEALQLERSRVSDADLAEVREMIAKLDEHVKKYMDFGGPAPLEVPFKRMSKTAAKVLCYVMKRFQWTVSLNLIAEQPRFQGGQPIPHHWVISLAPASELYDEMYADFEIETKQLLV